MFLRLDSVVAAGADTDIPIVAIGGINPENGARLIAAGANILAVITGLFGAAGDSSQSKPKEAL